MKTLFISSNNIEWGSARMRAYWPAQYMEDAGVMPVKEIVKDGQIPAADVYIWQKYVIPDVAKQLHEMGHRQYWDLCDPLHWFSPDDALSYIPYMGGIVCSTSGLSNDLRAWLEDQPGLDYHPPITTIPDRLEPSHFNKQRTHTYVRPVRFIWFGISNNRSALYASAAYMERLACNGHEIELTIMDERPDRPMRELEGSFQLYYTRWSLQREVEVLASHDVALLPPYPGPWGYIKSNNKRLTAWACGLPVVDGTDYAELEAIVADPKTRMGATENWYELFADYHVKDSAIEWEALLNERVPV